MILARQFDKSWKHPTCSLEYEMVLQKCPGHNIAVVYISDWKLPSPLKMPSFPSRQHLLLRQTPFAFFGHFLYLPLKLQFSFILHISPFPFPHVHALPPANDH